MPISLDKDLFVILADQLKLSNPSRKVIEHRIEQVFRESGRNDYCFSVGSSTDMVCAPSIDIECALLAYDWYHSNESL